MMKARESEILDRDPLAAADLDCLGRLLAD
jgi:hypothetical protein